jgi:hypothetical protein
VFLSRVLTATFRSNRRRTLPPDFGHHQLKSAVIRSRSGLMVDCRVEKRSSASSRIATYTCDSCGRVATSVRAEKLSHCCKKTTHPSVEIAAEIPIPKCEFGTDFIAVVCRGWVVDLLLASGRSSVHGYLWGELLRVQEYVDRLETTDENREATDIEVKYGNNRSLARADSASCKSFPAFVNKTRPASVSATLRRVRVKRRALTLSSNLRIFLLRAG